MAWFKRTLKGIRTSTKEKKDTPEGLWHKTPTGKIIFFPKKGNKINKINDIIGFLNFLKN